MSSHQARGTGEEGKIVRADVDQPVDRVGRQVPVLSPIVAQPEVQRRKDLCHRVAQPVRRPFRDAEPRLDVVEREPRMAGPELHGEFQNFGGFFLAHFT